jgi:hypothetical protein
MKTKQPLPAFVKAVDKELEMQVLNGIDRFGEQIASILFFDEKL